MNCEKIFDYLVENTAKYLKANNLQCMVLGISGGIDSTLTAAICSVVENKYNIPFYGISLPCSTNSDEENNSALKCMKAFCKEGHYWTENLQKEYSLMNSTCSIHGDCTAIGKGNIKARLRMIYLYDIAQKNYGLVMDTDNLTEHYLGFFTIHGDVADFNPIGGLWKHEVYELTDWLRGYYDKFTNYVSPDSFDSKDEIETREKYSRKVIALSYALGITPTDGNGVKEGGDMAQIAPAFLLCNNYEAYKKVDDILATYLEFKGHHSEEYQLVINELYNNYGKETIDMIINRHKRSEFKRKRLPIAIDRSEYKQYL